MKWVGVLPYVYVPYYEKCVATMHPDFKKNILFIDNTKENFGIMKSHNMGIDFMNEKGADWLIIISAAVRFGKKGGMDFVKVLEDNPDYYIIHAATANVKPKLQQKPEGADEVNGIFGWHLTAFKKEVFDNIGRWDENFTPYGFDDIDLSVRIQKFYKGKPGWDTFPVDVTDTTMAHSINKAGITAPSGPLMAYFKAKWGREAGAWQEEAWEHPFNNPKHSLKYWPKAKNGSSWDD